jgi:SAM-dependent methyltransferase
VTVDYEAELRRHDDVLRRASRVRAGDHVLDIGCGTGETTRWAAREAGAGSAHGIDISAPAIERARDIADGIGNITFEHADAQAYRFPREHFDLAISRFGTMFFRDPVAAFTNIGRALRPDGRLVMLVWQSRERNEWSLAVRRSLDEPEGPASAGPDAFSLAEPSTVERVLTAAGFTGVACTGVHEPVFYGQDVTAGLDWVRRFSCTSETLTRLDPAAAARALRRLRDTLSAHQGADGIWFDSRAWLVTAHRS